MTTITCSFKGCDLPVVCGLRRKPAADNFLVLLDVCRKHFKQLTGKAYRGKPRLPEPSLYTDIRGKLRTA